MKLPAEFYLRSGVVTIAQDLLGKVLCTRHNGVFTSGIITETEAYAGVTDRASHAFGGRRTARTEVMYAEGGTAYVYFCYGMHHLFNVVTNKSGIPHAVLVRAIRPEDGMKVISNRRKRVQAVNGKGPDCNGPGKVAQALGIHTMHTGLSLLGNKIWIEDRGIRIVQSRITKNPRIGVDYAGADALLPYRFTVQL